MLSTTEVMTSRQNKTVYTYYYYDYNDNNNYY